MVTVRVSIGSDDAEADLRGSLPAITIGQTVGSGHFNRQEVPDQST